MPSGAIITTLGLAKLASATPLNQLNISTLAVGDGNGGYPTLDPSMTALANEVWRGTPSPPTRDPNSPNVLIFEAVIPPSVGGFTVREQAIFDDAGDMIAIGQTSVVEKPLPNTATGVMLTVRLHIQLDSAEQVDLFFQDDPIISADNVSNANGGSVQDFIDAQYTTVAELATGKFKVGQYVRLTDRAMGLFLLQSGGVPTGGRVLDAGNGNTAELQITYQTFIEQWGAKGDWDTTLKTGTDNYPVFSEMIAYIATLPANAGWVAGMMEAEGLRVSSGRGTFGVSQTVDWGSVSVTLDFAGTMQTIFEAMPAFTANTPVFRLGSKSVQKLTKSSKLQNCSFNCGAITGVRGFEFYGLRDSSKIADILVTGFTGTAVYSDFAGQAGGAWMTQGLEMSNVHAISFVHNGGVIYDIGGVFESKISTGKALLNSASASITADIIGYRIGRTECRGVHVDSCSAGNFFGTGYNAGLVYENATRCWDTQCTYEGINGPDVEFGKTQTCAICYSGSARHYNPNPVAAPNNKQYIFRSANSCGSHSINASASAEAVSFEVGSVNCCARIDSINGTVTQARTNVFKFNGGAGNLAEGYASTDGAIFAINSATSSNEGFGNGALEKHDQFWSSFFLAAGGYRWRRSSDNAEVFTIVNSNPASNGTSVKLMVNNGTITTLRDVAVGAADSGGSGYRLLRVLN